MGQRYRRLLPADRRWLAACLAVAAVALVVAVIASAIAVRGATSGDDDAARRQVIVATADAVEQLMTFTPQDTAAQRATVGERLTGALAADYLGRGPDVVFSGAVESQVTMRAEVLEVGVQQLDDGVARTLVFVDQTVSVTGDPEQQRLSVARWATLHRVDGRWLLARLETVSP